MKTAALQTSSTIAARPLANLWRVAGAAVMGVSHKRSGLPCQDVQGFRVLPDGTLLVALADGAGSAPFSQQGACAAVESALSALAAGWELMPSPDGLCSAQRMEDILRAAFSEARAAVLSLVAVEDVGEPQEDSGEDELDLSPSAAPRPQSARDYASTLTCAIAAAECLAVGQVGDGAVVALTAPDQLQAVTRLQRGEYANETHFLTQDDALDQLIIDFLDRPVNGLAVMSDGLIRLALRMPSQEPHLPFFQPLFRFAETIGDPLDASAQLAAFLDSERVNARTDDDKSLVLAVRTVPVVYEPSPQVGVSPEGLPSRNGEDE